MKLKKHATNLLSFLIIFSAFQASGCGSFWFLYTPSIPNNTDYNKYKKILLELKHNY